MRVTRKGSKKGSEMEIEIEMIERKKGLAREPRARVFRDFGESGMVRYSSNGMVKCLKYAPHLRVRHVYQG
jgi:hypothetical protein